MPMQRPGADAGTLPKRALAPQGAAEDDKARTCASSRDVDRGVRNLQFDARDVARARARAPRRAKRSGPRRRCCCRCAPQNRARRDDGDALAFVRATLLDPAYQLK